MTAALAPINGADLQTMEPVSREVAVTQYLTSARDWLTRAVQETGPEVIAAVKAEIATAAEATRQLGLSKEIQDDAKEMVRRAEYALGKAIRKGQEEGTVETIRDAYSRAARIREAVKKSSEDVLPSNQIRLSDLATPTERTGGKNPEHSIFYPADNANDEQFEEALTEAKAEGNLSRANVARKINEKSSPKTRADLVQSICELAEQSLSSRQIAAKLEISFEKLRGLCRDYDIDVPADEVVGRTKRVDSNRAMNQIVLEADALLSVIRLVEVADLDPDRLKEWATSLSQSLRSLNKFANQLKKELTHG